jgi:hypothetical protein
MFPLSSVAGVLSPKFAQMMCHPDRSEAICCFNCLRQIVISKKIMPRTLDSELVSAVIRCLFLLSSVACFCCHPLLVSAVILSVAKDPEAFNLQRPFHLSTDTFHDIVFAVASQRRIKRQTKSVRDSISPSAA